MARIDQSEENNLMHTLRIELVRGEELFFNVDFKTVNELEAILYHYTDDHNEHAKYFISFHAIPDRMIFVKIRSIKRITFRWDVPQALENQMEYIDNFGLSSHFEGEPLIPSAILLLRGSKDPVVYEDLDPEEDFLNINEDSFENPHYLKGGFIGLPDEDGEQNYIPVINLEYMEVDRCLIYPDQVWEAMQNP